MHIQPHTISLACEKRLGNMRIAGNQRFCRLNETGLQKFKLLAAEIEPPPAQEQLVHSDDRWIAALGWDAEDQQVLRDHT